jgi:uncharacterized low-complexity protein
MKTRKNTVSLAVGTALIGTLAASPIVSADSNPFGFTDLSSGYMVADKGKEGSCGEAKCGDKKAKKVKKEGSCGEAKCGDDKKAKKAKKEGSCGEAKCGDDKKKKMKKEASCGESKCGSDKKV